VSFKSLLQRHELPQELSRPSIPLYAYEMFLSPHSAQRNPQDVDYPANPLPPGSIRLVRLMPGEWTATIRCELFDAPLGFTRYRALSYVWGSKNVQRPIKLNNTVFPVTVNLEGALRHLRELHKADKEDFVLWIDALSINQRDIKERTIQVQMMGKIYAHSEEVVVYLGDRLGGDAYLETPPPIIEYGADGKTIGTRPCDRHGADLFDVFNLIGEFARGTQPAHISAFSSYATEETAFTAREGTSRLFEAMRRLMYPPFTPWWSRIWVVQEITLNPKIAMVYGTITAPWAMLASAADKYTKDPEELYLSFVSRIPRDQVKVLEDCFSRIRDIDELRIVQGTDASDWCGSQARFNTKWPFLDLLRKFRDRRASDPRDKVFALLGLARPSKATSGLLPDYSLSEVEVFRQATLACIYEAGTLSVFSIDLGRKFRNDLASWIPDWGAPGGFTYEVRGAAANLYTACPSLEMADEKSVRPIGQGILQVQGRSFDTIVEVHETMWDWDTPSVCRGTLVNWYEVVHPRDNRGEFRTNETRTKSEESFKKMICAEVVCESGAKSIVRRMVPRDELTLILWASKSPKSTFDTGGFRLDYLTPRLWQTWSEAARAWLDTSLLWPDEPVLDRDYHDLVSTLSNDAELLNAGLLNAELVNAGLPNAYLRNAMYDPLNDDLLKLWMRCRLLFDTLGRGSWTTSRPGIPYGMSDHGMLTRERIRSLFNFINDDNNFSEDLMLHASDAPREDAPWLQFVQQVSKRISEHYGGDIDLNLHSRKRLIPALDDSIMAATLNRRLIVGEKYIGLGPSDARIGDKLFLLQGGKTPFVLRPKDPRAYPNTEFEVVGDCYIQGMMDGPGDIRGDSPWMSVSLV
jgi:hypothetical protein